jgi:PAS domain S-box-containing protein
MTAGLDRHRAAVGPVARSEATFQGLLELAPDAIVGVDAGGRIVLVNAQAERLFGWSRAELLGQPVELLVPDQLRELHVGLRQKYLVDPVTRPMGSRQELVGQRKDGSRFPADITLGSLQTEDGLIVSAAVRDVTERKQAEEKFRGLLESAPDAIVGVDVKGHIVVVNAQAERLFGWSRDELLGRPVELLVPEGSRAVHAIQRSGYFANPVTRQMGAGKELAGRRKDGSEFTAEISLSGIRSGDGLLVSTTIRDVTERRHAFEALREQAETLRKQAQLLDLAHDAIIVSRLDGTITFWNRAAEEAYGWTAPEALGRHSAELLQTELPEPIERIHAALLDAGRWEGELLHARRDGSRILLASRWALQRDEDGAPSAILELNRDITVQREAELEQRRKRDQRAAEALQREREFSSAVVDTAGVLVLVLDQQGRITRCNPAVERATGYAAHELAGRHLWAVFVGPEEASAVRAAFDGDHPPPPNLEFDVVAKDGRRRFITWSNTRLKDDDGHEFVIAAGIDITERRHAEQALAATAAELDRRASDLERSNAELEQFAYVASHDLSAPLRTIGLFTQLLAQRYQGRLDDDAEEYIGHIVEGVGRMRAVIDDVLSFARAGQAELELAPVDLAALVARTVEALGIAGTADVQTGPLGIVQGDPTQLGQLVQNLVANAIKFNTHERPWVRVSSTHEPGAWHVTLADDGIGIEPKYAERVFKMFQRLNRPADYAGTGLGLALCKRVIERHGGRIWFEPRDGGGTVFHFTIPDRTEK